MNLNRIEAEKFDSIIFFTGAGMSKESNIDTYRGEGGIWNSYNWKEFACQKAFIKNPLGNILTRLAGLNIVLLMSSILVVAHSDWFITTKLFSSVQIFLLVSGLFFFIKGNNK